MCDPKVWVHLLKGTAAFPLEKVEELVNLAGRNRNLKMMVDLLRAAASKLPCRALVKVNTGSGPRMFTQMEIFWAE